MRPDSSLLFHILGCFGLDHDMSSPEGRISAQYAIYLYQIMGVNMGYHYIWSVNGPYCSRLSDDLVEMEACVRKGSVSSRKTDKKMSSAMDAVLSIMKPPESFPFPDKWMVMIVCCDFLGRVVHYNKDQAQKFLVQHFGKKGLPDLGRISGRVFEWVKSNIQE